MLVLVPSKQHKHSHRRQPGESLTWAREEMVSRLPLQTEVTRPSSITSEAKQLPQMAPWSINQEGSASKKFVHNCGLRNIVPVFLLPLCSEEGASKSESQMSMADHLKDVTQLL